MSYAGDPYQPSVVELARSGNFRAIAYWLNVFLLPHNLYARVEAAPQPGCLQVLVEFHPSPDHDAKSPEFRGSLVRFICHHLWKLNSDVIEGVQVAARFVGKPQTLWQQSVRVMSPARRAKLGRKSAPRPSLSHPTPLRSRVQQATRQKVQFRALRSLLLTGTTAAAFIIGCWLGYGDAPTDQTNASASPIAATRPDTILTAMGNISVEKHQAPNSNDPTATLMFGGDVTLTDAYTDLVGSDPKWAFAALEEYRQADVAMVNLEAPFTTATLSSPNKEFNFKSNPETVQVLKNGGVDLVNLANNHVMDYQTVGLDETLKTLDQVGIHYVGAGRNTQEARRPEILDVKGQRIAYLGYYDGDFQTAAGDSTPGTNEGQHDRIAADIKAIRNQVDWVVVNYHWGVELAKYPTDAQIDLAHFTIDQGADLVVGHHPHILQGAEIYKGRPIIYSLGNFIFGGNSRSDYDTAVLRVGLKDNQMKVEFLPIEVKSYQPRVVSGDRGTEILQQIENVSDIFQEPMKSPVILDARSRTVISTPTHPDAPANSNPSKAPSPAIESVPSPSQTPNSEAPIESIPSPQIPNSETVPSPSASESPADTPMTQPSQSPAGAQPWKNDSFISAPSPSPTIAPDASPAVTDSPDPNATPSPEVPPQPQGDASVSPSPIGVTPPSIAPTASPKPTNSLEPMKKRYAQAPSPREVAAAISSEE
jgi:Bacterial capsule synthesis protein PGA_cap